METAFEMSLSQQYLLISCLFQKQTAITAFAYERCLTRRVGQVEVLRLDLFAVIGRGRRVEAQPAGLTIDRAARRRRHAATAVQSGLRHHYQSAKRPPSSTDSVLHEGALWNVHLLLS